MEKEPYQLPEGTLLQGQYVIKNVLGQGGFGITYMGWDMHLDTPVAIKEYFPKGIALRDSAVSEDIRCRTDQEISYYQKNKRRFMQEAKTLAQFSKQRSGDFRGKRKGFETWIGASLQRQAPDHGAAVSGIVRRRFRGPG